MRTSTHSCVAVVTFAILFHLSVVSDKGKHLGENHQKLAIPAAKLQMSNGVGKEAAAMTAISHDKLDF
jgi:hypothetical protein